MTPSLLRLPPEDRGGRDRPEDETNHYTIVAIGDQSRRSTRVLLTVLTPSTCPWVVYTRQDNWSSIGAATTDLYVQQGSATPIVSEIITRRSRVD